MDSGKRIAYIFLAGVVILAAAFVFQSKKADAPIIQQSMPNGELIASVTYACDDSKSIAAEYYDREVVQQGQGQPPIPGGTVVLRLSDERTLILPQTISGSGVRYANAGESIIFWNKGNTAMLQEGGEDSYKNCAEVAQSAL